MLLLLRNDAKMQLLPQLHVAAHLLPNALARTKPSPAGPKPLPGVVTMLHFSRISANTSQLGLPGKPTHTYGASSPPEQETAQTECMSATAWSTTDTHGRHTGSIHGTLSLLVHWYAA
jgi:hypothetical protein